MALTRESLEQLLDEKLKPLLSNVASLTTTVEDLRQSVQFVSSQFDEMTKRISSLEELNSTLSQENNLLKSTVFKLTNEVQQLRETANNQEQYLRRDCLEIKGIPVMSEEDTDEIVQKVAEAVNVNVDKSDISVSHRLFKQSYSQVVRNGRENGDRNSSYPSIIVKFTRRNIRDNLYHARKRLKDVTTNDLHLDLERVPSKRIFITESLTKSNKELFKETLAVKRECGYKFIWTNMGRIFLRKNERSPAVSISSEKNLDEIRG